MSVTQVIYKDLLQMPPFEPPEPKGKKTKYAQDKECWLCGGDTEQKGWHLKDVLSAAFTDNSRAACPQSQSMCYSCAALLKREAWELACDKHGHSPYFPSKDGKAAALSNWMFNSHVISRDTWLMPARNELAELLVQPPAPPFVITIADTGKKHVLFKAKVSHSRDDYFVNIDESVICVNRARFTHLLRFVEQGYQYFSKDSLLTGEYNQAAVMKVGLKLWREFEDELKPVREQQFDLLRLACFVARKTETA